MRPRFLDDTDVELLLATLVTMVAVLAIGFVALWTIFQFRSFKDVIAAGRADREGGGPPAAEGATAAPAAPRARA